MVKFVRPSICTYDLMYIYLYIYVYMGSSVCTCMSLCAQAKFN